VARYSEHTDRATPWRTAEQHGLAARATGQREAALLAADAGSGGSHAGSLSVHPEQCPSWPRERAPRSPAGGFVTEHDDLGVDGISFTVHPLSGFRLPSTSGRGSPEARSAAAPEESIYLLPFLHASSPRGAARFPLATGATKKQQDKVCGRSFWNLAHQMQPERQMREIESESCSAAGSVQGYAGEPSAS